MFKENIPTFKEVVKLYETMINGQNITASMDPVYPKRYGNPSVSDNEELFDILTDIANLTSDCMSCEDDPSYAFELACHCGLADENDEYGADDVDTKDLYNELIYNGDGEGIAQRLHDKSFTSLPITKITEYIGEVVWGMVEGGKLDFRLFAKLLNKFLENVHIKYSVDVDDAERLIM